MKQLKLGGLLLALVAVVAALSMTGSPASAQQGPDQGNCHPSYDPCVPNGVGDINCDDLAGPVAVNGPDDFGLDADNDGVGCEDDGPTPATTTTTAAPEPPSGDPAPAPAEPAAPVVANPSFTG